MTWENTLVDLVQHCKYMTLATADGDGTPWVSPVVYGCDDTMRFYWVSGAQARHSINIETRPQAALSIFDPEQVPNSGVQGVYAEGSVELLAGSELAEATDIFYRWRYPDEATFQAKRRGPAEFEGDSPRRMYRLQPSDVYGLDPDGDPEHGSLLDYRVPVQISARFAELIRTRG